MKINEQNVISQLTARNQLALEFIIDRFGGDIYGLVASILKGAGQKEDIEDCVSEVFCDIWDKYEGFDPQRGNLKTWLLVKAKYKALDYRRSLAKNKKIIPVETIENISLELISDETSAENLNGRNGGEPIASVIQNEEKEALMSAIRQLGATDREIFLRRYFYYQEIEEIAKHLKLTREAVDNRLSRGRRQLRDSLAEFRKENIL